MSDSDSDRASADEGVKKGSESDDDGNENELNTRPLRRKLVRRVIASDDDESDIASDDGAGKSKSKAAGLFNDSESEMSGSQQESRPTAIKRRARDRSDSESAASSGSGSDKDSDEDNASAKKSSKRRRYDSDVDDEDYELLEENMGVSRDDDHNHQGRLKRGVMADSDEEGEILSGDERKRDGYFDDEDEDDMEEDDDIDDFIVKGSAYQSSDRGGSRSHQDAGYDYNNQDELVELFGDPYEYQDIEVAEDDVDMDEDLGSDDEGVFRKKAKTFADVFEPSLLKEQYLTEQDEVIKLADVPERIQTSHIGRDLEDEEELKDEADWIYANAFIGTAIEPGRNPDLDSKATEDILNVLTYMRKDHYDTPFIKMYRKEYYRNTLEDGDLWEIWDWDARWKSFHELRTNFVERYNQISAIQAEMLADGKPVDLELTDDYLEELKLLSTTETLHDANGYIQFRCRNELEALAAKDGRRIARKGRDVRTIAKENGLQALVDMCCLKAQQFGENLNARSQIHFPPTSDRDPDEVATDYQSAAFSSYKLVLRGAMNIAVKELSVEPSVRKYLRAVYYDTVVLSITPTPKGISTIDNWHPLASVKFLRNKPLSDFQDNGDKVAPILADILKGEQEGLIKLSFDVQDSKVQVEDRMFYQDIKHLFLSPDPAPMAQAWNDVREMALVTAIKLLFGHFEKELRKNISRRVRKTMGRQCQFEFYHRINKRPFALDYIADDRNRDARDADRKNKKRNYDWEDWDYNTEYRLKYCMLGVTMGDNKTPFVVSVVDAFGTFLDYITLPNFGRGIKSPEKQKDIGILRNFIKDRKPIGIAIASGGVSANNTKRDLQRICDDLYDEKALKYKAGIELVDSQCAQIFALSKRSKEEFGDYPDSIRTSISIARTLQDPLLEYAGLAKYPQELCALNLDRGQDILSKEEFYTLICRVLIDIVNKTGVKINEIYNHPNQKATLQFISGFGPRKANALIENLEKDGGYLVNRQELITRQYMGAKMFENCSGFICVIEADYDDMYEKDMQTDRRDESRIHPESYKQVEKIAMNALDKEIDEDNPPSGLELVTRIFDKPQKLEDLDLKSYAKMLFEQFGKRKARTLQDIADEVKAPFKDSRSNYHLTQDETFKLLTGEDKMSLNIGMKMNAVVRRIERSPEDDMIMGVSVKLDNDMDGFIPHRDFSDTMQDQSEIEQRVAEGQVILVMITEINQERCNVKCTCKSSALNNPNIEGSDKKDFYYDVQAEHDYLETQKAAAEKKAQLSKPRLHHRNIKHPNFKNFTYKEAEEFLRHMPVGEALVRPSAQNAHSLALTWKVAEDVYAHVPIKESNRKDGFNIGSSLLIGKETYDDLDEIISRYVFPLADLLERVKSTKNYHEPASQEEMFAVLSAAKAAEPKRIPYFFSPDRESPGRLLLSYMPSRKPKFESVNLTPDGFKYRGLVFSTFEKLVGYFKTNFNKDPNAHRELQHASNAHAHAHDSSSHRSRNGHGDGYSNSHHSSYANGRQPPPPPQTPGQPTDIGGRDDRRDERRDDRHDDRGRRDHDRSDRNDRNDRNERRNERDERGERYSERGADRGEREKKPSRWGAEATGRSVRNDGDRRDASRYEGSRHDSGRHDGGRHDSGRHDSRRHDGRSDRNDRYDGGRGRQDDYSSRGSSYGQQAQPHTSSQGGYDKTSTTSSQTGGYGSYSSSRHHGNLAPGNQSFGQPQLQTDSSESAPLPPADPAAQLPPPPAQPAPESPKIPDQGFIHPSRRVPGQK